MSDTITCEECKHQNPAGSLFCNNCGIVLKGNPNSRIQYYETRIEDAAKRAETEVYERVTKWAKLSTWVISIAFTIIGATISVGAYLGFGSILDFRKNFDNYNTIVKTSTEKIENDVIKAEDVLKRINDAKGVLDDIVKQKKTLQYQLNKTDKYYMRALKLGNKFFDLNMQISENLSKRNKLVASASSSLIDKGFIVDAEKIFYVDVDKTEVIYYSHYTEHAAGIVAKDIAKILTNEKVNTRLVKSSDRNRYKILIKIANLQSK